MLGDARQKPPLEQDGCRLKPRSGEIFIAPPPFIRSQPEGAKYSVAHRGADESFERRSVL